MLAEKVIAIQIYANEYKLTAIRANGFRVDDSHYEPQVPLFFSDEELADKWVRLRPETASAFHIRFSGQTQKRFFHATGVPEQSS